MTGIVIGIIFGVAIVWTAITIITIRVRQRRNQTRFVTWAASREFDFREGGGGDWEQHLPQGDDRGVRFQLDGFQNGRPVTVANYYHDEKRDYTDSDGFTHHRTDTTDLTVVVARLASRRPAVDVVHRTRQFKKPRKFWGSTTTTRFLGEILTEYAEFDRDHSLRGDASQLTPAVITATMQSLLHGWAVQEDMLIVFFGGEPKISLIDAQVGQVLQLASALESPPPNARSG